MESDQNVISENEENIKKLMLFFEANSPNGMQNLNALDWSPLEIGNCHSLTFLSGSLS